MELRLVFYTLTETAAPEGYQIIAPMNITLTPGRTEYVTVPNEKPGSEMI